MLLSLSWCEYTEIVGDIQRVFWRNILASRCEYTEIVGDIQQVAAAEKANDVRCEYTEIVGDIQRVCMYGWASLRCEHSENNIKIKR